MRKICLCMQVNDLLRARNAAGRLPELAFAEGVPLALVPVLPKLIVVPEESAFPGYGGTVVLPDADHIHTCKPTSRQDVAYARLLEFLAVRAAEAAGLRAACDGAVSLPSAS